MASRKYDRKTTESETDLSSASRARGGYCIPVHNKNPVGLGSDSEILCYT